MHAYDPWEQIIYASGLSILVCFVIIIDFLCYTTQSNSLKYSAKVWALNMN